MGALHVRRAGWLSAQQLGMYLLEEARAAGVRLLRGRVVKIAHSQNGDGRRVRAVHLENGERIPVERLVLAAGPFLRPLAAQLGLDLPVVAERHLKLAFDDRLGALPREAPLLIWADPQELDWTPEERALLDETETGLPLSGVLPSGAHTRPEGRGGSRMAVALWEYDTPEMSPVFPVPGDDLYPEVVLRGLERMLPAMRAYRTRLPRPIVDGGYYVKTPENRPLIGPLPVAGAYVLGALSGYGIMASQGAADLLAAHLTGKPLPPYAAAFHPDRYRDPAYRRKLASWREEWQL
ncbi:MAG: FAD-binding oxidoreductase [Anaerolineae bacterium]|nr:MAG: FAD-binding oxidoreductase [Anaerolineae bacterium]